MPRQPKSEPSAKDGPPRSAEEGTGVSEERNRDIYLGFLIHDVSRLRKRAFDVFMRPMGITRSQWWVIANLSRNDGIVQSEFAEMLDLGRASLGFILDRLEGNGLIERRTHPSDRRAKCIFLTDKAKQLLSKMLTVERRYDELVLKHLNSQQRDSLIRLLEKIKEAVSSARPSPDPGDADPG